MHATDLILSQLRQNDIAVWMSPKLKPSSAFRSRVEGQLKSWSRGIACSLIVFVLQRSCRLPAATTWFRLSLRRNVSRSVPAHENRLECQRISLSICRKQTSNQVRVFHFRGNSMRQQGAFALYISTYLGINPCLGGHTRSNRAAVSASFVVGDNVKLSLVVEAPLCLSHSLVSAKAE